MPAGEPGDKQPKFPTTGQSTRAAESRQPTVWPDNPSMVAQQGAANRMFRENSERMQQAADAKRQAPAQEQQTPERTLHFAKDGPRHNFAELKHTTAENHRIHPA